MKIALVSPYDFAYPGGVVAHISHLSRELERLGHTTKIIAPASGSTDLEIDNLIPVGSPVPIPSGGSIARISISVWRERKLRSILKEESFDVIHLHEPLAPVLPLTVLRLSNTATVGTFHAFHGNNRMYRFTHKFIHRWFNRLDYRIAVSEAALQFVSKFFPSDYQIIPNGIDVDSFSTNEPPFDAFKDDKFNILFVGRLEKRKGLKYLLQAFSQLKWDHPYLRLIVVGPGNLGKECYRIIAERNIQDVVLVGGVSDEALRRYYKTADIFCAPATGKESFGIVLGEAMAAGKPIVASDIDGFRGVITNGREGILVPPRNEEALAAALESLIMDPGLCQDMGQRGRVTVQSYRWDLITRQLVNCYEKAIKIHSNLNNQKVVIGD